MNVVFDNGYRQVRVVPHSCGGAMGTCPTFDETGKHPPCDYEVHDNGGRFCWAVYYGGKGGLEEAISEAGGP